MFINNPMNITEKSSCIFCAKTEDESELIDIESNSLLAGDLLLEFSDLIFDVLNLKVSKILFLYMSLIFKLIYCRWKMAISA